MRRSRGLSLLEMLLAGTLFSIVALLSFTLLSRGVGLWTHVIEAESAGLELAKASHALRRDLTLTRLLACRKGDVPAGLGAGAKDGAALWFLSAQDPATGEMVRKSDGTPYWQRNILYYLIAPSEHEKTFGVACEGGAGPDGFDDRCPHKVLIRKVIDSGPATSAATDPETSEEELLANVSDYLTRPKGYAVSPMAAEPGVERAEPVAVRMLWFQVKLADPAEPGAVHIDIRAVAVDDAAKHLVVGRDPLAQGSFTLGRVLSVEPMN